LSDFQILKRLDKVLSQNRRDTFTDAEIVSITHALFHISNGIQAKQNNA
jgi:hypothetical protein